MILINFILQFINKYFTLPFDIRIQVNNFNLFANKPDRILAIFLWKFGLLEKNEIGILRRIIKKNMCVLDIGANIGYYTTVLSELVGNNGSVHAFEPEKNNYRILSKVLRKNTIINTQIYNYAVSDINEIGELYVSKINSGDNRLNSKTNNHEISKITKINLDDFMHNKGSIDFIKIDIQGGEMNALLGMQKILSSNDNLIILIELDKKMTDYSDNSVSKLIDLLKNYFKFCYLVRKKNIYLENDIFNYINQKNYTYENILFSKKLLI